MTKQKQFIEMLKGATKSHNTCTDCKGLRKVLNMLTKEYMPCTTCFGDGTIGLTIADIKPFKHKK